MVLPLLALYVEMLGGTALTAGIVIGAFSVISFGVRPFIGYATDRWSMYLILQAGALILSAFGLLLVVPSLAVTLVANSIRGVSWAAINTAGSAVLARIAPPARRGEASGYFSISANAPMALAPAVGLWLIDAPWSGFRGLFLIAAGIAFLGFLAAYALGHSAHPTTTRRASPPPLNVLTLIDRGVLISSILSVCLIATSPAMTAFLPVYARAVGVDNLGVAFIASGVATIGTPLAMGRLMSRLPRGWWIALGFVVM